MDEHHVTEEGDLFYDFILSHTSEHTPIVILVDGVEIGTFIFPNHDINLLAATLNPNLLNKRVRNYYYTLSALIKPPVLVVKIV